jgi:hypothetical protein
MAVIVLLLQRESVETNLQSMAVIVLLLQRGSVETHLQTARSFAEISCRQGGRPRQGWGTSSAAGSLVRRFFAEACVQQMNEYKDSSDHEDVSFSRECFNLQSHPMGSFANVRV